MSDVPSDASPPGQDEHRRIRDVYRSYRDDPRRRRIWSDSALWRRIRDRKWSRIHALLDRGDAGSAGTWGVDLGSGSTADADRLSAAPRVLAGIVIVDLLPERLGEARDANRGLQPVAGDAALLPLRAESVGIAYQSTMLSSVLDDRIRASIFEEIRRVLRPGGAFVSYDTRYLNPWNRNTRPVGLAELRRAFAGWWQASESITGLPQPVRILALWSSAACAALEALPPLRSHRLFVAVKPEWPGSPGAAFGRGDQAVPSLDLK